MISFSQVPAIGTMVMLDQQTYRLLGTEPYIRSDGSASTVLTWVSECPTCGDEFTVQSGLKSKALNRRCEAHRRVGAPVGKRGKKVAVRIIEPEASE